MGFFKGSNPLPPPPPLPLLQTSMEFLRTISCEHIFDKHNKKPPDPVRILLEPFIRIFFFGLEFQVLHGWLHRQAKTFKKNYYYYLGAAIEVSTISIEVV